MRASLSTSTLWPVVRRIQLWGLALAQGHADISMWWIAGHCWQWSASRCCSLSAPPSAPQCDNCGIEPIQGVRWHCQDCPPEMSLDFCDSCSDWWAACASTCDLSLDWIPLLHNCYVGWKSLLQHRIHILCWVKWKIIYHLFVGDTFCKHILDV